jgi:hypothetical protein
MRDITGIGQDAGERGSSLRLFISFEFPLAPVILQCLVEILKPMFIADVDLAMYTENAPCNSICQSCEYANYRSSSSHWHLLERGAWLVNATTSDDQSGSRMMSRHVSVKPSSCRKEASPLSTPPRSTTLVCCN